MKGLIQIGFAGMIAMTLVGCEVPKGKSLKERLMSDPRFKNAVCEPFSQSDLNEGLSQEHGWIGALAYLGPRDRNGNIKLSRFEQKGIQVNAPIYMREVNVPTQAFDRGFKTGDDSVLRDLEGNILNEYFGIELESEIRLSADDQPGYYQFSVLSDDGSILAIDPDGRGFKKLIDNDGDHQTKLACAKKAYYMDHSTRLPMRLGYYQGPRYHVALMILWKRVGDSSLFERGHRHHGEEDRSDDFDDFDHFEKFVHWGNGRGCGGGVLRDPACGWQGNSLFFNSAKIPSSPQPAFIGLLQRGWKVLGAKNAYLPFAAGMNPCIEPAVEPSPSPSVTAEPTAEPTA
ncbi:MAG TPA: hypothetical protein DCS07_06050, partial [Bdellovibrionales bacterium]|nr:hypothetical protein [Bdellovibrionales bacterium]HCM39795.1 hypothetical protein [Bdellovibrionales bacterium]